MEDLNKENKYLRARERVTQLKKFYSNLTSYVLVIGLLAGINYWSNEWRYMWFLWAALGWGIGIAFHAFQVFGFDPLFGRDWEERKIQEFMDEDEKDGNRWV